MPPPLSSSPPADIGPVDDITSWVFTSGAPPTFDVTETDVSVTVGDDTRRFPFDVFTGHASKFLAVIQQLVDRVEHVTEEVDELVEVHAVQHTAMLTSGWDPTSVGLVPVEDHTWSLPDNPTVTMTAVYNPDTVETELRFFRDSICYLTGSVTIHPDRPPDVRVDTDDRIRISGWRHPDAYETFEQLTASSPFIGLPDGFDTIRFVMTHAEQIIGYQTARRDLYRHVTETEAAAETDRRDAERAWRKTCRSKDHIPTKALKDLTKDLSYVSYTSGGWPESGWDVRIDPIVSRTRPDNVDDKIGTKEVFYVVKLEPFDARYRHSNRRYGHKFYPSDATKAEETLPGCVVKMPEDRSVMFIAVDTVEHVEQLDAAITAWVLTNQTES